MGLGFAASLQEAYKSEVAHANREITKVIQAAWTPREVSFMQKDPTGEPAFQVKVSAADIAHEDPTIIAAVDAIESTRSQRERQFVRQACSEMKALTSIVLAELGQSLRQAGRLRSLAFLAKRSPGLAKQANVRIQASREGFPRIADEIQDMQMRRDRAETKERQLILELELNLLKAENDMIASTLQAYA